MDYNKVYVNFKDWFDDLEQHNLRSERLFAQLQNTQDQRQRELLITRWMEAAWEQGRLSMLWENY